MTESDPPVPEDEKPGENMTGRQAYNLVSDTVTGANVRFKDNLIQAIAILLCSVLGAGVGSLLIEARLLGALLGAVIGMLVGLFGSGTFLMVFRLVQHSRGRHD